MLSIIEAVSITRRLESEIANTCDYNRIAKIIENELNQLGATFKQAYIEEFCGDDENGEYYQVNYIAFYKQGKNTLMIEACIPQEDDVTISTIPLSSEAFENRIRSLEESENVCEYKQ